MMWSEPRRAHPASVIVYSTRFIGLLFAPAIIIASIADSGEDSRVVATGLLMAGLFILAALGAIGLAWAEWYRFTFHVTDRTLRVEHGLIVRKSTRLTPERIQSIDTKANLLFRILGLVTVDVHTAGRGQAAEVSIPALAEAEAKALIAELRKDVVADVSPAEPRTAADGGAVVAGVAPGPDGVARPHSVSSPPWRLSTGDVFLVGATSSAGVLAFAAIAPVAFAVLPAVFSDMSYGEMYRAGVGAFAAILFVFAIAFAVIAWVMGTVAAALQYWDFVTVRSGDEVRVERGLLQRETRSVPLRRVQAVRLVEGPLRQALGRVTVGVDAAGIAAGDSQRTGPTVLHPLLGRADVVRFVDLMVPGHRIGGLAGLPRRARRRYVIRAAVVPLVVALGAAAVSPWGLLALVLPLAAAAWGLLVYADAAWGLRGDVLGMRFRYIARTTVLVRRQSIQSVAVSQHPLQRIAGLGTLAVNVASSPPTTFRLAHIPFDDGLKVVEWVSGGVELAPSAPSLPGGIPHPEPAAGPV